MRTRFRIDAAILAMAQAEGVGLPE